MVHKLSAHVIVVPRASLRADASMQAWGDCMQDIVAEGKVGLERAIEGFEPERGLKFSTYAHFWIRRFVSKCVADTSTLMHTPASAVTQAARAQRTRAQLRTELGRAPSDSEIAKALGVTKARTQVLLRVFASQLSFDAPMGKDSETDTLADQFQVCVHLIKLRSFKCFDGCCGGFAAQHACGARSPAATRCPRSVVRTSPLSLLQPSRRSSHQLHDERSGSQLSAASWCASGRIYVGALMRS